MKLQIRLIRDGVPDAQRLLTDDFDNAVQAARSIKDLMIGGGTGTVQSADTDELAVVDWSKVSIAYVRPIE